MLDADDFLGRWRLDRQLTDRLGPMSGAFSGEAAITRETPDHLGYAETGTLTLVTGAVLQAERRYIWQWQPQTVQVLFSDGAPFHHFTPDGISEGTPHVCGADLYHVTYRFTEWPRWEAVWRVNGPKKNYISTSRYARL